ncbi:tRNA-splicing endonuclease subunit [Maudiozyma exigua]|uniref:tRNA-splicing endonuclease subunit Sen34 n=1 Tax=Maudiozyma exigua TaxID=34358 RepID=A0A9P6VYJ0_MAUEX|nr:tRNA-splicing endonuclease subunit [Kazachstania exigua]
MTVTINLIGGSECYNSLLTPLVFNIDDIKKLRELGICGILSGTLPTASQQNIFLTVPLKLMVEEAIWLHIKGLAKFKVLRCNLLDSINEILEKDGEQIEKTAKLRLKKSFDLQREYKKEQHLLKLERLGITDSERIEKNVNGNDKLLEAALFIETPTTSNLLNNIHLSSVGWGISDKLLKILISQYGNWDNYLLFQALRDKGYVLAPGGRFGGKFIAYPGDPLRYHSHMIIRDALHYREQPIDFLELAANARLGTGVKKIWVIGSSTETDKGPTNNDKAIVDDNISFYSIEWAGFG